jgi:glycosyltransferase involved in cell wall biosynthesis
MHYHRELGLQPFRTDHATWRLQLSRGDFFLCSSEEQRLYYLGWLTALGRVNPVTLESDPRLRDLIVELPFGTPGEGPPVAPSRNEVLTGVGEHQRVLYFGGIYDWYDPDVVLEALPSVLDRHPETVLVFVDHPHPELTPQSALERIRKKARTKGWLGETVRFEPWRPLERRFDLPLVSDLAVVTHTPGLETDLSLRTRLVDLMWLGLPTVVTAGGTMARIISEEGAGAVVPPGEPVPLAEAICTFLEEPAAREAARSAARRWAATRSWQHLAAPLLRFAENPWRDRSRERFEGLAPGEVVGEESLLRRIQRRLRRQRGRG